MSKTKVGKKLVLSLLVLLLSLAGAEGVVRVWLRVRGEPFDQLAQQRRLEAVRDAALGRFSGEADDPKRRARQVSEWNHTINPYFTFDKHHAVQQLERDLARAAGAGPERYALVILGGSVAAGFGLMGKETLKEILESDPRFDGRRVEVLNYGVSAFKEPQQLMKLAYLFSVGLEVDAVINLDGFNEVAIGNSNASQGVSPAYPVAAEWIKVATDWTTDAECFRLAARVHSLNQSIVATIDQTLTSPLRWSAIFGLERSARVGRLSWDAVSCQRAFVSRMQALVPKSDAAVRGPKFDREGDGAILSAVRTWMESSFSMQSLCAARDVAYLHVLQPTLLDPGSKVATLEETASARAGRHWVRGVEVGYPLLRQAGRDLAQRGVGFFDASGVFLDIEERIYTDPCHFGRPGNEILAEAIGRAFLDGM